jgi:site-specific DNA-methyltransferase (adenine-specific)
MSVTILNGDWVEELRKLESGSVHCSVSSPPYWGLRDYGVAGQLGLETTPELYIRHIVAGYRELRRVLRDDGTLWINLGDCYNGQGAREPNIQENGDLSYRAGGHAIKIQGLKKKDMVAIPWRVALALQADGWYLRSDIIWHKPNPMPESVSDRPTKSHEYIFLLSKSESYYYDAAAIKEKSSENSHLRYARGKTDLQSGVNPKAAMKVPTGWDQTQGQGAHGHFHRKGREGKNSRMHVDRDRDREHELRNKRYRDKQNESFAFAVKDLVDYRNKRTVWTVPTKGYSGAHFATYPPDLIRPCILAGCPVGGTVLDPFGGSGTTGEVAEQEGRNSILIELNPEYIELIKHRTAQRGLFT